MTRDALREEVGMRDAELHLVEQQWLAIMNGCNLGD
jgi:hypothetical protein